MQAIVKVGFNPFVLEEQFVLKVLYDTVIAPFKVFTDVDCLYFFCDEVLNRNASSRNELARQLEYDIRNIRARPLFWL